MALDNKSILRQFRHAQAGYSDDQIIRLKKSLNRLPRFLLNTSAFSTEAVRISGNTKHTSQTTMWNKIKDNTNDINDKWTPDDNNRPIHWDRAVSNLLQSTCWCCAGISDDRITAEHFEIHCGCFTHQTQMLGQFASSVDHNPQSLSGCIHRTVFPVMPLVDDDTDWNTVCVVHDYTAVRKHSPTACDALIKIMTDGTLGQVYTLYIKRIKPELDFETQKLVLPWTGGPCAHTLIVPNAASEKGMEPNGKQGIADRSLRISASAVILSLEASDK
eukprot:5896130-Amphidinium_carterae.1